MAVEVEVCCYLDDPGRQLDGVHTCELVVVAQVKYMVDEPGGWGCENVVGKGSNPGSDPGSAGVVDRVGQVPVEDLFNGSFPPCSAQLGTEGDEFLVECFLVG